MTSEFSDLSSKSSLNHDIIVVVAASH